MSTSTAVVNEALIYILVICVLLLFLIVFFMIYFLVRYRKSRNPVATDIRGNNMLEIIWVVVPTVIVLTMFFFGLSGYQFLRNTPADSIPVRVYAQQWSWVFEYTNGKKSADLVVPLSKNVRLDMTSSDVIHAFYVPDFRIQVDIVPGMTTRAWFRATELGAHYNLCAQYCGLKHSSMISKVIVVAPDIFNAWLSGSNVNISGKGGAEMPAGMQLLFERGCMSCHSIDGTKMSGPTFQRLYGSQVNVETFGKIRTLTVDDPYIWTSITNPKADVVQSFAPTMPDARQLLSDEEIGKVIGYLKTVK